METVTSKHWTVGSIEDFAFRIASDFLAQVETKIEAGEVTRAELAHRLSRTPGRVSQLLNNPGNLTLTSAVRLVRAAGMKVALVAYEDNDPQNNNGPVNSEIFSLCWQHMGAPKTFFEYASTAAPGGPYFNACTVSGSGLAGFATGYANSAVFSYNTHSPLPRNHGVEWGYIPHHSGMGTGDTVICDANKGLIFNEDGIGFIGNLVDIKATTTTTKVTRNCFIPMEA
jgi:hypothetical protein